MTLLQTLTDEIHQETDPEKQTHLLKNIAEEIAKKITQTNSVDLVGQLIKDTPLPHNSMRGPLICMTIKICFQNLLGMDKPDPPVKPFIQ